MTVCIWHPITWEPIWFEPQIKRWHYDINSLVCEETKSYTSWMTWGCAIDNFHFWVNTGNPKQAQTDPTAVTGYTICSLQVLQISMCLKRLRGSCSQLCVFTWLAKTHPVRLLAYSNRRSCQTQSTASPPSCSPRQTTRHDRQPDRRPQFRCSEDTHLLPMTHLKPQHASLSPLSTAHRPIHNNETGDFHGAVRNDLILAGWMIAIGFASSDN